MQTEALRANLERTAVDVEIPADHEVLLEISEPMFGVHRDTERLLREIHHEYVGWLETLPELHRRAMNDVYHYTRHERAVDGLSVYGGLYAKAAAEASPADLREDAVRWWLAYLSKVVEEAEDRDVAEAVVTNSVAELGALVEASPRLAAAASGRLRRLTGLL